MIFGGRTDGRSVAVSLDVVLVVALSAADDGIIIFINGREAMDVIYADRRSFVRASVSVTARAGDGPVTRGAKLTAGRGARGFCVCSR